ncbi:AAA family ATPase [Actinocatenispora sera]|uniref:AAA family ATPase n=1 Tax=Actinocatenispora sera TaxID=390989 RepID=UPI0033FE77BC
MSNVINTVVGRVQASGLSMRAASMVRAALLGDAELQAVLAGEKPPDSAVSGTDPDRPAPHGVYLTGITVMGFRGIGPEATLRLTPEPGLTVVCGRNGTGKSSFAEAAELVLTGENMRWSLRSKDWQDGWHNLHVDATRRISVSFVAADEGAGLTQRTWPAGAKYHGFSTEHEYRRGKVADLGWRDAMKRYRPFLSAAEFDALLRSTPSQMYDAFAGLLGLSELAEAEKRLSKAKSERGAVADAPRKELAALRRALDNCPDARAAEARQILGTTDPDVPALTKLVQGTGRSTDPNEAALRTMAAWQLPERGQVTALTTGLAATAAKQSGLAATAAGNAGTMAQLLRLALDYQHGEPGCACPICGQSVLDDRWRHSAHARLAESVATSDALQQARQEVVKQLRTVETLVATPPPVPVVISECGAALSDAHRGWKQLVSSGDATRIAAGAEAAYVTLYTAATAVRAAAERALGKRDEVWQPMAARLAAWVERARQAEYAAADRTALGDAKEWLAATAGEFRRERLAPLADRAKQIWRDLGQDSSIQLEDLDLVGDAGSTKRKLKCLVHVDGTSCQGFSVASQGELHGLALSLFLPRATSEDSPFRFLVIDDPVQAMDPTRVHRLAVLLAEEAKRCQIVVFTHDDRLPEAVRSLQLGNATIQQVSRKEGSVIQFDDCSDPVQRYLDDAKAVLRDHQVSERSRTVAAAGLARDALEACAQRTFRHRELSRGRTHEEVEERLSETQRTKEFLALALEVPERGLAAKLATLDPAGTVADPLLVCNALNAGAHDDMAWLNREWPRSMDDLVQAAGDLIAIVARS